MIEKIENFIKEKNIEVDHMLRAPFWLKEIYPEADEAFLIAALCHDIERCFPLREEEIKPAKTGDDKTDQEYLKWHGNRSAEFAEKLLRENGFNDEEKIVRIKGIIAEHSFGGTKEKDLMMDADSLSFFENNALAIVKKYDDKERMRKKINSEFNRIVNDKAKKLAQPFFEKAMNKLS